MKLFFLALMALLFSISANAETDSLKSKTDSVHLKNSFRNSFQLELLGNGGIYSLNYERIIFQNTEVNLAIQVGTGIYANIFVFPFSFNQIWGIGNHHFDSGFGFSIITRDNFTLNKQDFGSHFFTFRMGYRYQKPNEKFVFRAGFTPVILTKGFSLTGDGGEAKGIIPLPWFGLSFGTAF